jgi:hypothetical protein
LHALGLALFLPRATAAVSPFGLVVIDDPMQAMDPAKVYGLARVLSSVALSRQVVFTHDDRLPAALRQLQLRATVAGSVFPGRRASAQLASRSGRNSTFSRRSSASASRSSIGMVPPVSNRPTILRHELVDHYS